MKKNIQTTLIALFALLPLGMQAQSVVTKELYEGTQILNSDFEDFHTVTGKYVEPNSWHSFESATGSLASMAGHHLVKKEEKRTNGKGSNVCAIYSTSVWGVVANGTVTTGRMNAGSMSADDASGNYAYTKVDSLDENGKLIVDNNGDQFCSMLTETPAELSVWYKFKQKKENTDFPYASISAVITNGERYQDPEEKDSYSKVVVAKAQNRKISQTGDTWTKLTIPFDYNGYQGGTPKAILVTITTNATPGKGSANDSVLIDDLELVYNRPVTIPESGYLMMTNLLMKNYKIVIPKGITAYTLEANSEGKPKVKEVYKAGQALPYEAAILLEGKPGEYPFSTTIYEAENIVADGDLCIVKSTELNTPTEEYKFFRLSTRNGILGFYPAAYGMKVPENESLLRVKSDIAAENYQHVLYKAEKEGDVDGNGKVEATDVKALVDRLLGNELGMKGFLIPDADVNGDKTVDVADVTQLINILLHE